ncbi:MAG: glutamate formimidoyltransferase [Anaerolineales bacterium]|jgi:glutamate formiminotransferase/formiminotetrahydrofolate cyclodeaminase
MQQKIVECVPNFSEGRREDVILAIREAIEQVHGVYVLDLHSDDDHNRTVITFAGQPEPVAEAAFQAIQKASVLINLDEHSGEHPRIGATDVVPFVPISGVTMDECVELAKDLGARVAKDLNIPVYLYEKAATRPERENLANIRRGEYEQLKAAIETDPERAPDFGPSKLGKAGATVIGARVPLIAFNVYLTTDDVDIATKIGRAIRHSSGGLRYVKALGMLVDGRAQVSMNLTDFKRTPLARVVENIRREAERYGVGIHHSELVGLIPQAALVDAAQWYIQLDQFVPDQILETRLYAAMQAEQAEMAPFLNQLAAGTATPGGGSAAAYAAAMGASLIAMVARLTIGKKKYADVEKEMETILEGTLVLQDRLYTAVEQDSQAFEAVMNAYRMPKQTDQEQAERKAAIQAAMVKAAEVPLMVCKDAVHILAFAADMVEKGNRNAISDAGSAGVLAGAAFKAAQYNVRINAGSVSDQKQAQKWLNEVEELQLEAERYIARLDELMQESL